MSRRSCPEYELRKRAAKVLLCCTDGRASETIQPFALAAGVVGIMGLVSNKENRYQPDMASAGEAGRSRERSSGRTYTERDDGHKGSSRCPSSRDVSRALASPLRRHRSRGAGDRCRPARFNRRSRSLSPAARGTSAAARPRSRSRSAERRSHKRSSGIGGGLAELSPREGRQGGASGQRRTQANVFTPPKPTAASSRGQMAPTGPRRAVQVETGLQLHPPPTSLLPSAKAPQPPASRSALPAPWTAGLGVALASRLSMPAFAPAPLKAGAKCPPSAPLGPTSDSGRGSEDRAPKQQRRGGERVVFKAPDEDLSTYVSLDNEMGGKANNGSVAIVDGNRQVVENFVTEPLIGQGKAGAPPTRCIWGKDMKGRKVYSKAEATAKVRAVIAGRKVVGHGVQRDLEILDILDHPQHMIYDTRSYPELQRDSWSPGGRWLGKVAQSLADLAWQRLGRRIQSGNSHCAREDALANMDIFLPLRKRWEALRALGQA
ncbi:hypothetical protein WJX73_009268 [Symbiochloris irregularis]|uniref:Exonuclease domain-containing protein n=1 Tax=Symbiochloris irregularis TaxID=706552 RepID=A0AAW1PSY7_9CHLO